MDGKVENGSERYFVIADGISEMWYTPETATARALEISRNNKGLRVSVSGYRREYSESFGCMVQRSFGDDVRVIDGRRVE